MNIGTIKANNALSGKLFFSRESMRFFKSRVFSTVYGGKYFITRETNPSGDTRFTVREAHDGGKHITTVGPYFSFRTLEEARDAARERVRLDLEEVTPS